MLPENAACHCLCGLLPNLSDEAALLIALNLSEVRVGPPVHHHLIQHLILLPLHGLAITEHFTEEPHTQCDVHALHLHVQHEHDIMSECQQGLKSECSPDMHVHSRRL